MVRIAVLGEETRDSDRCSRKQLVEAGPFRISGLGKMIKQSGRFAMAIRRKCVEPTEATGRNVPKAWGFSNRPKAQGSDSFSGAGDEPVSESVASSMVVRGSFC